MLLGLYFNISAAFWLNLQARYDLEVMEGRDAGQIARDVRPFEAAVGREAYPCATLLNTLM